MSLGWTASPAEEPLLQKLGLRHLDALTPITTNVTVMRFIMKGKTWRYNQLHKRLAAAEADWAAGGRSGKRGYFWAIMSNGQAVGMLGFHHSANEENYSFRIFLDPSAQNNGLGTQATRDALRIFAEHEPGKRVYGAANADNIGGAKLMLRVGFVEGLPGNISGTAVRTFVFTAPGAL